MKEKKMEKTRILQQIRAALMDRARDLKELSDQAYHTENRIIQIAGQLAEIENNSAGEKPGPEKERRSLGEKSNIIPFPGPMNRPLPPEAFGRREAPRYDYLIPILARPGEALPLSIPDFRPMLQRDGLILLSWAKKHTEMGERYTAYWVTSQGISRYYASKDFGAECFASAVPIRKSYAAEDGIEFYGQNNPAYMVHVAPDLMVSKRQAEDMRPEHIKNLRALGMNADYNYHFLLTTEKKKRRILSGFQGEYSQSG
jgi:hypothetical protein